MNYKSDIVNGSFTSIALCSVSDVTQYLGISSSASITGFISSTIDRVSKSFESYCHLPIKEQSFLGYYDGDGTDTLFLNNYPIISVSSVKYRLSPSESYSNSISVSNFSVYDYKIVSHLNIFPYGNLSVEIKYNAGYSIVPYDIQECAIEATAIIVKESFAGTSDSFNVTDSRLGKSNRNIEGTVGGSETFIDISDKHKQVLDLYSKVL